MRLDGSTAHFAPDNGNIECLHVVAYMCQCHYAQSAQRGWRRQLLNAPRMAQQKAAAAYLPYTC